MLPKETRVWLRTLGIAKILFEYEGYHCLYREAVENFIWRKTMYSPKIREELIPKIFRMARAEGIPMTKLVNRILERALNGGGQFAVRKIDPDGKGPALSEENVGDGGDTGK